MNAKIEELEKRRTKAIVYMAISAVGMIVGAIIGAKTPDLDQPFGLILGMIMGCAVLTWIKSFLLGLADFLKETFFAMIGQGDLLSAILRLLSMIVVIAVKSIFWAIKSLFTNVKEVIETTKAIKSHQGTN